MHPVTGRSVVLDDTTQEVLHVGGDGFSTERNLATAPPQVVTIYVRLLDEGVDVFRPTDALMLPNGKFELKPTPDYDPAQETWEFLPMSEVAGEARLFANGPCLIAVAA